MAFLQRKARSRSCPRPPFATAGTVPFNALRDIDLISLQLFRKKFGSSLVHHPYTHLFSRRVIFLQLFFFAKIF